MALAIDPVIHATPANVLFLILEVVDTLIPMVWQAHEGIVTRSDLVVVVLKVSTIGIFPIMAIAQTLALEHAIDKATIHGDKPVLNRVDMAARNILGVTVLPKTPNVARMTL